MPLVTDREADDAVGDGRRRGNVAFADGDVVTRQRDVTLEPPGRGERHAHGGPAGGQVALAGDRRQLGAEPVVRPVQPPTLEVERVAPRGAAVGDDHAVGAVGREIEFGHDAEPPVAQVGGDGRRENAD